MKIDVLKIKMMLRVVKYTFLIHVIGGSFFLGLIFFIANNKVIDFSALENYDSGRPTILLDDEGNEWARFQLDKRESISIDKIPKLLINAFVAREDWNFFNHFGISWKGIIRSIIKNVYHGKKMQGASTITQQLVRLLFFYTKKTFRRKLKEQVFALLVECQFTKEQILETYLNHVYFGRGIYGVQAACQRFWDKEVSEISLDEAAVLAGIVRSPENYCPIVYPLSAQRSRDIVLMQMKKLKFITDDEYKHCKSLSVRVKEYTPNRFAPHLKEYIRIFLEKLFGKKRLYTGGLTVQTTISKNIQKVANENFLRQHDILSKKISEKVNGALISMDVSTGEIKALIGGADFGKSQFNRAFQARRQMGSVFKPILYSVAMQKGMSFSDTEIDEPIELVQNGETWRPNNAYLDFDGQMSLAWALSVSNNIIAIKTLLRVGFDPVIDLAKKFRLRCELKPYPSLALGCIDVSLKEVVGMFNVFANNGVYVEPHCIKWVKDQWGTKVFKHKGVTDSIISSRISGQVAKVLQLGLLRIRRVFPQKWMDAQAISKTGTTNDSRVCWFVGSTPSITTGVYIGRDDNKSMGKNVYPLRTAFPIWIGFNREIACDKKGFTFDPSLREVCVNSKTGESTLNSTDPDAITILI